MKERRAGEAQTNSGASRVYSWSNAREVDPLGVMLVPGRCHNNDSQVLSKGDINMLVLSRRNNESIVIGHDIVITVVEIRGDKVRLGIDSPTEVPVHRQEVYDAIHRQENSDIIGPPHHVETWFG